jgi:hypothetical protein
MSVTQQHQKTLDILFSGTLTSDTITSLHLNGSLWELGGGTRFSCKLCWNSMEYMVGKMAVSQQGSEVSNKP